MATRPTPFNELRYRITYANVTATAALFLALSGGVAVAAGGIPGEDGKIQGCYSRDGGLRVVSHESLCRESEEPLYWNQQGPKGEKGETGERGPQGPQGEQGPKGDTGSQGDTRSVIPRERCGPPRCSRSVSTRCFRSGSSA